MPAKNDNTCTKNYYARPKAYNCQAQFQKENSIAIQMR